MFLKFMIISIIFIFLFARFSGFIFRWFFKNFGELIYLKVMKNFEKKQREEMEKAQDQETARKGFFSRVVKVDKDTKLFVKKEDNQRKYKDGFNDGEYVDYEEVQ